MNSVAIITARGGSKRIPRKNIRLFHGKPIISYAIEAALASGIFSEVMVSTDDEEISAVAKSCGAVVPFLRSPQTSNDHATTAEVLAEVLGRYADKGKKFVSACCIYPTAAFVTSSKLRLAYKRLTESNADVVYPIAQFEASIWRALQLDSNDRVSPIWPENALKRSQDLPGAWYDCGQYYFFDVSRFLVTKSLSTQNTIGIPVPSIEVQDIDTNEDWRMAEIKYSYLQDQEK